MKRATAILAGLMAFAALSALGVIGNRQDTSDRRWVSPPSSTGRRVVAPHVPTNQPTLRDIARRR